MSVLSVDTTYKQNYSVEIALHIFTAIKYRMRNPPLSTARQVAVPDDPAMTIHSTKTTASFLIT